MTALPLDLFDRLRLHPSATAPIAVAYSGGGDLGWPWKLTQRWAERHGAPGRRRPNVDHRLQAASAEWGRLSPSAGRRTARVGRALPGLGNWRQPGSAAPRRRPPRAPPADRRGRPPDRRPRGGVRPYRRRCDRGRADAGRRPAARTPAGLVALPRLARGPGPDAAAAVADPAAGGDPPGLGGRGRKLDRRSRQSRPCSPRARVRSGRPDAPSPAPPPIDDDALSVSTSARRSATMAGCVSIERGLQDARPASAGFALAAAMAWEGARMSVVPAGVRGWRRWTARLLEWAAFSATSRAPKLRRSDRVPDHAGRRRDAARRPWPPLTLEAVGQAPGGTLRSHRGDAPPTVRRPCPDEPRPWRRTSRRG